MSHPHRKALGPEHPSAKQVGQAISPPPCEHGIPIYPLRYGVAEAGCHASTGLHSPYPALSGGKQQGLRALRPGSYVYACYFKNKRLWTRQYRVNEQGWLATMWWTQQDYQGDFPGRHARIDTGREQPYLLIPQAQAKEPVWLMVSDTILSHRALCELESDAAKRQRLMREVKPLAGTQAHCFDATQLPLALPELSGTIYPWSNSWPQKAPGQTIADAMRLAALPLKDLNLLAVALPDPVGMLVDLNLLVGAALHDQEPYATEAARKLRVWGMIDSLAHAARQQAYDEALEKVTLGGVRTATHYPDQRGNSAYASRMVFANTTAYQAFIQQHPQRLASLQKTVDMAAADLWAVFQALKPSYHLLLDLYESQDIDSFLDRREMGACTLTGLVHHPEGESYVKACVTAQGLTGWLADLALGHPTIGNWLDWRSTALGSSGNLSDHAIERAQSLLQSIPANAASQQLSAMVGALVARGKLISPSQFWTSAYRPAFEALDGQLAEAVRVPLKDAGQWVRSQLGLRGSNGFRPRTIAHKGNEMLTFYQAHELPQTRNAMAKAATQLRQAHDLRLGFGGLAVMLSTYNAAEAFNALGKQDGLVLANALDAGGKLLALGSSGLFMKQVYQNRLANLAREAGQGAQSTALRASAEIWELRAIGVAAVAAAVFAIKDFLSVRSDTDKGAAAAWSLVSGTISGTAASLGGLYVLGQANVRWVSKIALIETAALTVARAGSGPLGWTLLALDGLYTFARYMHDRAASEQALNEWIARSIWGNGRNSSYFSRTALAPYASDAEELQAFYSLFLKPSIQSDVQLINTLNALTLPGLAPLRHITVTLPGWRPQISAYRIQQVYGVPGRIAIYDNPDLVVEKSGVGLVTLSSDALVAKTEVEYWPNGFTEPEYMLRESNYL